MALRGFSIALSGRWKNYRHVDLQKIVVENAAKFKNTVSARCTHLIINEETMKKSSAKFEEARDIPTCEIVSLDWLLDSVKAKAPLSTKEYLLVSTPGSTLGLRGSPEKGHVNGNSTGNHVDRAEWKSHKEIHRDYLTALVDTSFSECPKDSYASVVTWGDSTVLDATLIRTAVHDGHDEFCKLQVLKIEQKENRQFITWIRWGGVGEKGHSLLFGGGGLEDAVSYFMDQFERKSGLRWRDRLRMPEPNRYQFRIPDF